MNKRIRIKKAKRIGKIVSQLLTNPKSQEKFAADVGIPVRILFPSKETLLEIEDDIKGYYK